MALTDNELLKRLMIQDASFLTCCEKLLLNKNLDSSSDLALMSKEELSSIINRDLAKASWSGKAVHKKVRHKLYFFWR